MGLFNRSENTLSGLIVRPHKFTPPNDYYYQPFAESITFESSVEWKLRSGLVCSAVDSKGQLSAQRVLEVQGLYIVVPNIAGMLNLGISDKADKLTKSETFIQVYYSPLVVGSITVDTKFVNQYKF